MVNPHELLYVHYPSGAKLVFFGQFQIHGRMTKDRRGPYGVAVKALESTLIGGSVVSAGSVVMLDPRGVIIGEKSGLIYNPRQHCRLFPVAMRQWMQDNPKWPPPDLVATRRDREA